MHSRKWITIGMAGMAAALIAAMVGTAVAAPRGGWHRGCDRGYDRGHDRDEHGRAMRGMDRGDCDIMGRGMDRGDGGRRGRGDAPCGGCGECDDCDGAGGRPRGLRAEIASELKLTADQANQAREIVTKHRSEIRDAADHVHDARLALRDLVLGGADEGKVRSASTTLSNAIADAAVLAGRIRKEVAGILTPEQAGKINDLLQEGRGRGLGSLLRLLPR